MRIVDLVDRIHNKKCGCDEDVCDIYIGISHGVYGAISEFIYDNYWRKS